MSCGSGNHLTDELKIKLPSSLTDSTAGSICLLISAYCYKVTTETNTNAFFSSRFRKYQKNKLEDADGKGPLNGADFIGCGFLPLSKSHGNVSCLIENGIHNVPLEFYEKPVHPTLTDVTNQYGKQSAFSELTYMLLENNTREIHSKDLLSKGKIVDKDFIGDELMAPAVDVSIQLFNQYSLFRSLVDFIFTALPLR
jgi:hypothetical protein